MLKTKCDMMAYFLIYLELPVFAGPVTKIKRARGWAVGLIKQTARKLLQTRNTQTLEYVYLKMSKQFHWKNTQ